MVSRWGGFPPYVSVKKRKRDNQNLAEVLIEQGYELRPVHVIGNKRHLAHTFWGQSWCRHLNSFSDYENRLPRGRSYLRQGAVLDLGIEPGLVSALVSGSELYEVKIQISTLKDNLWTGIQKKCSGQIASLLELLQGKLSDEVMKHVVDKNEGLFPSTEEISLTCSCPDWAEMCKHVAAVLYGVGVRLDNEPELLFLLRGVSAQDLIGGDLEFVDGVVSGEEVLDSEDLAGIFGIEILDSNLPIKLEVKNKESAVSENKNYAEQCQIIQTKNEELLENFSTWLSEKGLKEKTITKHSQNISFFINEFLLHSEQTLAVDGISYVSSFQSYWFIKKAGWASVASIKANATSLKKFYAFLEEQGQISKNSILELKAVIKEEMPDWIGTMQRYDDPSIQDMEDVWFPSDERPPSLG